MADCTACTGTAVLGYGSTVEAQDPSTMDWVLICGITNFNGPSSSRGEIDVTTLCSPSKEYVLDLKDFGTIDMSGLLLDGNRGQMLLDDLFNTAEKTKFRLTLVDDGYGNGAVVRTFDARVQSQPVTVAQGAANQVSFTLRITGDVITERPTSIGPNLAYSTFVLNEAAGNDGAVSGVISVVLSGDTFAGTDGDEITAVTFTGIPAGLTGHVQKINTATAVINFSGNATNHAEVDKAQIGLSFEDAAFTTGPASIINGSTNRQITINFVE
ncbi:hypothetical protein LJC15_05800 [Desulfovibrio sp. OttesenSCG-928-G11]|nr:hypothetical protein [Desulfovibrio sp. OttesenSCG-928-G11]